jgi:hypothetical protein
MPDPGVVYFGGEIVVARKTLGKIGNALSVAATNLKIGRRLARERRGQIKTTSGGYGKVREMIFKRAPLGAGDPPFSSYKTTNRTSREVRGLGRARLAGSFGHYRAS